MDLVFTFLNNIFWFVVLISVLVFVHEFGHFIVARFFKVEVEVFSLGIGRKLLSFKDKMGTVWCISMLPIGGYVKMFGDLNAASVQDEEKLSSMSQEEKQKSLAGQSVYRKFLIVFAGPFANYLLAALIFTGMFFFEGKFVAPNEVKEVVENSPAALAGIKPNDVIVNIDNKTIDSFSDIEDIISVNPGKTFDIKIRRGDEIIAKKITAEKMEVKDAFGDKTEMGRIGITAIQTKLEKLSLVESLKFAVIDCYRFSVLTLKSIGQMIIGTRSAKDLGGPIKIARYSSKSASFGARSFLMLMAILSLNLGLFNLLPIPLLDGGHLMYYTIEILTQRKIPAKIQNFGYRVGFSLIAALFLYSTVNDIVGLL